MQAMANRIREFRERAGLSMQALADRVGTTAPQINKLEKGERRLTVDWMVRIGRALSIDPAQLMITDHTPPSGAPPHPALPAGLKAVSIDVGQADLPVLGRAQGGKN